MVQTDLAKRMIAPERCGAQRRCPRRWRGARVSVRGRLLRTLTRLEGRRAAIVRNPPVRRAHALTQACTERKADGPADRVGTDPGQGPGARDRGSGGGRAYRLAGAGVGVAAAATIPASAAGHTRRAAAVAGRGGSERQSRDQQQSGGGVAERELSTQWRHHSERRPQSQWHACPGWPSRPRSGHLPALWRYCRLAQAPGREEP